MLNNQHAGRREGIIMRLYIYDAYTKVIIAISDGKTNKECEDRAQNYIGTGDYGGTYSPAFGSVDGLIDNPDPGIL